MLQPKKDYTNNVFNALKAKVDGFDKSQDEFKKALLDDNYKIKVYNALKAKVDGFDKSQDEFIALITPQKKKNNSSSLLPKKELDSKLQPGFSGGIEDNTRPFSIRNPLSKSNKIQTKIEPSESNFSEGSMAWNLEKMSQTRDYITLDKELKNATSIPDNRIIEIRKEVEDEAEGNGIWNTINKKAGEFYNTISEKLGPASRLLGVGNKIETDPLAKEKKEAVSILTKKGLKKSEITNDLVKNTAIDIKTNKIVESEKQSKLRDYLADSEDDYDDLWVSKKDKLERQAIIKVAGNQQQKSFLEKEINIKDGVVITRKNNIDKINSDILSYQKRGELVPQNLILAQKNELKEFQNALKESISSRELFVSKDTELKDAQSNLDYFKRDYSKINNLLGNVVMGFNRIGTGLLGALDYGLELKQSVLGENSVDKAKQLSLRNEVKETDEFYKENVGDKIMKPIAVDDIHSLSDFGRWLGYNVVANQVPIYMAISTGTGGIGTLGATSTGEKYEVMINEINSGEQNYDKRQLLSVPLGYGLSETASAMVTKLNMNNAAKIYQAATQAERTLITENFAKQFISKGGDILKAGALEYTDEAVTQIAQNYLDINILGKEGNLLDNVKDAGLAGFAMGALLPSASHIVSQATKPFSLDTKIQNVSKEILSLQSQLDKASSEESKQIISDQIKEKETRVREMLQERIKNISSMSQEDFDEILRLEKAQQNIRNKANVIKSDTSIDDEMTNQILSNLSEEFKANESRRKELLTSKNTTQNNREELPVSVNDNDENVSKTEGKSPQNKIEENTDDQPIKLDSKIDKIEDTSLPKEEVLSDNEEKSVVEKTNIKAKNFRDLYNVNRKIFGQNKIKSLASTIVMDRIVGQMANRANVSKQEIYDTLEFTKTDESEIKSLSDKGKILYQIAGKNAKVSNDIKDGLSVARKMEKDGSDPKAIRALTGWEKGADGKWGYEFDDSKVTLKGKIERKPLSEFINHDELFQFYPEFKDIDVIPNYDLEYSGLAITEKNRIMLNPDLNKDNNEIISTILHEVQHFIQNKEGFARGGSEEGIRKALEEEVSKNTKSSGAFSRIKEKLFGKKNKVSLASPESNSIKSLLNEDDFKLYQSLVGEVQARNVEIRKNMSPVERRNTLLSETEDIRREEQIILFQGNKGAVQIQEDGQAVIHAITNPDVSTPLHELAHVYEKYLTEEEKKHILKASNTNEWTNETSEYFARGFEKYLADGVAPDSILQKIFDKFKEWLTDIYNGITDSEIDIELNAEMKRIYSEMLGIKSENKNYEKTLKTSENSKSYNVSFENGILSFTDENGNETSDSTTRRLQDKWAENFDYTRGRTTFEIPNGGFNINSYEDYVASVSENPAEVAEALVNLYNTDVLEGIDYKTKIIAENIGSRSINRESFIDFSDINHVTKAIELNYFANKGKGRSLDTLAQELSEQANLEVTEQDIVEFILDNPVGVDKFINSVKREKFEGLENRFKDLTGLPPLQRYLEKAIEQQIKKDQWINDYATSLDFLSDENIVSLLAEYENYGTSEKTNSTDTSTTQGSTFEDSETIKGESRIQAESRSDVARGENESETEPGIEYDNSDLEDDTELHSQGITSNNQNQRDLLLSDNGAVKLKFPFQKHFKRLFSQTFRANAGLDIQTGEVVRSRNRTLSAFTDHLEYESNEFNKIIHNIKKTNPKKINDNLLTINDYLSGNKNADISFLNNQQKEKLDYFRERINSLSRSIIENLNYKISELQEKSEKYEDGSIGKQSIDAAVERTQNLIDTIESNMDKYINRSYQIFSDDEYRDNITGDFDKLNKEGQLRIRNAINYLMREDGMKKEDATKAVAEYLSEIRRSKSDFPFLSNGNASAPFLKKRKDIPKEFRELLGESRDPLYNYINTVYKLSQYIANIEYQSKLRDHLLNNNFGKLEPELGYVKLTSNDDGWRILNDIYVPVDFKDAMDDMQPLKTIESGFYKAWIKIAGITKINKTILSPTTTARNLISGVFLGANSGHFFLSNPKAMAIAWNNAWTTKKSQKELFSERQKLLKLGVLGDGSNSGELLAILNDFSKEVDRMVNKNVFVQFFDIAKKAYAFGDDFYKVTGFYIEKNRLMQYGMSETEAEEKSAFRINNGYPTYSYLPKNMQRLRRLPLIGTFVSFPYESIRSTKNNLLIVKEDLEEGRTKLAFQRLSGMLVANATLNGLSALTMAMLGITDDDDDAIRDMLPEWQRNSKLIYVGTKNGKPIFIDGTALFPSETIFKPISTLIENRDGRNFEDNLMQAVNELLSPYISKDITFKTLMQICENKNQFDQKIYLSENLVSAVLNEPEKIGNYLMKQVGPGVYNNITEFLRANEVSPKYFGDKFSSYGKEYTNEESLLGLLGMRISTINYNAAMSSFAYQVKDAEQNDKSSASKLVKTSKVLSEKEIESIVADYGKYHNQNFEKMLNIVNSGKKMGMSDDDIRSSLKVSKMPNSDINSLINGDIPDLKPLSKQSVKNYKEKLTINYNGQNISEIKQNFDKNVRLLEKAILQYNKSKKSPD